MKRISLMLLAAALCAAPIPAQITATLDTGHGNANIGQSLAESVSLTITPTAGDGVTCEVAEFNNSGVSDLVSVSDNRNTGNYPTATTWTYGVSGVWSGIFYRSGVLGASTTVTATFTNSQVLKSISCQSWKPSAPATFALDPSAVLVNNVGVATANPTAGTAVTPRYANEVVLGYLVTNEDEPLAGYGANFTGVDADSLDYAFPEYWIQTTATAANSPYIMAADEWVDQQAAFRFVAVVPSLKSFDGVSIGSMPGAISSINGETLGLNTGNMSSWDGMAVQGAGTFSVVQTGYCDIGTGTSCTLAGLTQAPAAGNLYVLLGALEPSEYDMTITGTSLGGSLQFDPGCNGIDAVALEPVCYYILPSTSTGGSTTPTVSFNQAGYGNGYIYFIELHPSSNPNAVGLGNATTLQLNAGISTASPSGPNFNLLGTNDAFCGIVNTGQGWTQVTAASSPFNSYFLGPSQPGMGFACTPAVPTGSGPTWTFGASQWGPVVAGVTFGWNVPGCLDQSLVDWSGGTSGNVPAVADLFSSIHGWQGGKWSVTATGSDLLYQTAAKMPLIDPTGTFCDGTSYAAGDGSLGIEAVGTSANEVDQVQYSWQDSNITNASLGFWYYESAPATDNSLNDCAGIGITDLAGVTDTFTVNCYGNGSSRYFRLETASGNSTEIYFQSGLWHFVQITFASGNGTTAGSGKIEAWEAVPITSATCASGTTTLTLGATPTNLTPGETLQVGNVTPPGWNGTFNNVTVSGANVFYSQTCPSSGYISGGYAIGYLGSQSIALTTTPFYATQFSIGAGNPATHVTTGYYDYWGGVKFSVKGDDPLPF